MASSPPTSRPKRSGHPAEQLRPTAARKPATAPQPELEPAAPAGARLNSLAALGGLRAALAEQDARRTEARVAQARQAREAEQAANVFRHEVGVIQPLKTPPRIERARATPPPLPLQTQRDEAAVLNEALSDEFDPECVLDIDESLSFCRPGVSGEVVRKLRRGAWVVQAQIDLHGMRRDEARTALAEFLREAVKRGSRCVRVIHGKGLGSLNKQPVLKGKVRAWLVQKEEVIAFCQARPHDGGEGAVVVLLQPESQLRTGAAAQGLPSGAAPPHPSGVARGAGSASPAQPYATRAHGAPNKRS